MSKLLINEHPLQVLPTLAVHIGLNEAIILQQMHYWLQSSKHHYDDHTWIYNTYSSWHEQFPFWSESTIKRAVLSLEKKGLVISGNYNKLKIDKTKWYRIDYVALDDLEQGVTDHRVKMTHRTDQSDPIVQTNLTRPLPETTTETTQREALISKIEPLDDIFQRQDEVSEKTAPVPDDQWIAITNEFVRIFNDGLARYPKPPEKETIVSLAQLPEASKQKWKQATKDAIENHPHGSPNLKRIIEVYECYQKGGDWDDFAERKWGDGAQDELVPDIGIETPIPTLEILAQDESIFG